MEQQRDDLDRLIEESFMENRLMECRPQLDYEERLLARLHQKPASRLNPRTAALSLITAGLLLSFMYTSQLPYMAANLKMKLRTDFSILRQTPAIEHYLLGE